MIKAFSAPEMKTADSVAIDALGIPSMELMMNAAGHIVRAVTELLPKGGRVAVFCGSGNNGGDGIAAASMLIKAGIPVRCFMLGKRERMTEDTRRTEEMLNSAGGVLEPFSADTAREYALSCDVIIDAMFGVGLNKPVSGSYLDAVGIINGSEARVVAADIPSGISADTGVVLGGAVRADVTVTFSHHKTGTLAAPGCVYCGEVRVCDIGVPDSAFDGAEASAFAVGGGDISLPKRSRLSHKGDHGKILIIGGSVGYTGAPYMAAEAAGRTGSGLVFMGVPSDIYHIEASKCVEAMPFPLPCREGRLTSDAYDGIIEKMSGCDAAVIGPGLGRSEGSDELVCRLIESSHIPLVLDADGINAVSGNINILLKAECPVVLTPHEGEFARLGGTVTGGRVAGASEFSKKYGCITVLKGYRTVTAMPDGNAYVNLSGGPALAKGGSGDVLTGVIASLIGQGIAIKDAVLAAVYLHGSAGDICAERLGEYSVMASDVISALPEAIKKVMG